MDTRGAIAAYLNHGRWVVACPFCTGAELARVEFFCRNCNMKKNRRAAMRVIYPANLELIEKIVNARKAQNRNWTYETIDQLIAENAAHGLGV